MKLTEGILRSVESAYIQEYSTTPDFYIVRYKGKPMIERYGRVRLFKNESVAKTFITNFVKEIFWHGEYWQSCAAQIKKRTGFNVDYTGTIGMLTYKDKESSVGSALYKEIAKELIKIGIITIEKAF